MTGESKLPLQYEDGPDFCTVKDAQGRDFALTMQPDLMKAMEKALSDEVARFMRGPAEPRHVTDEDRNYASELLADLANGGLPRLEIAAQWFRKARIENSHSHMDALREGSQ